MSLGCTWHSLCLSFFWQYCIDIDYFAFYILLTLGRADPNVTLINICALLVKASELAFETNYHSQWDFWGEWKLDNLTNKKHVVFSCNFWSHKKTTSFLKQIDACKNLLNLLQILRHRAIQQVLFSQWFEGFFFDSI